MTVARPRRLPIGSLAGLVLAAHALAGAAAAAGPPFPNPIEGVAVYDTANVLSEATEASAEATIDAIEARVGAEVAVYTQLVPDGVTTEEAERHAIALMDQWGVGRRGFDDGLVILFDLERGDPCHGQVQLYGGPGYRASYLSNGERQAIYENEMLPLLRSCDLDGALLVALAAIDLNATPEHANALTVARQVDAALGLLFAPVLFVLVVGSGAWQWLRFGRDPEYLDDPSIHLPAPPRGLTPASGALVVAGRSGRRALTAALLDLAGRGEIGFREEKTGLLGRTRRLTIETGDAVEPDPSGERIRQRADRRPISPAETFVLDKLQAMAADGLIEPDDLPKFAEHVSGFEERLETYAVRQGWFGERPRDAMNRWRLRGVAVLVVGGVALFAAFNLPSAGLTLVGGALVAAGVGLLVIATAMPARTLPGAMVRAMLAAYARTLDKTMAQARSMGQVVDEARIPIVGTPDEAVVWGVALGLQDRVEDVLKRTAEDLLEGRPTDGYLPTWYHAHGSGAWGSSGVSGGGVAPGLMAASAIPNLVGMMSALSTIGNAPSSSGSGGGGFGGGSSGGGGGGAGGGF